MSNSEASGGSKRRFRRHERPIKRGGIMTVSFEPYDAIRQREVAALTGSALSPHISESSFQLGMNLAWELYQAHGVKGYSDDLSQSLVTLFIKSLNDLLSAVLLCRCGYYLPAVPLLRGALESAELMEYFLANESEVVKWMNKHKHFDNLGWLREKLPQSEYRKDFYDIINDLVHCNAVEIQFFSSRGETAGDRTLFVGPFKLDEPRVNPISLAAGLISYPIRVLWKHDPSLVSEDWVTRFEDFDGATGYAFSSQWKSPQFTA